MDRSGANFRRCVQMIKDRLGARPMVVQLPIGSEDNFRGMIDLVEMKALVWFSDDKDSKWEIWDITPDLAEKLNITVKEDVDTLNDIAIYRQELIDTALESPLGQISMVPLLAWIANSAPPQLKATYFAVMASFTNLALSASQLGTHYLNEIFVITREMRDPVTHLVTTPADYQALGMLLTVVLGLGLITPFAAMALTRLAGLRSA
jgi:translation elongation factor EF-G